jgi:hypothetical protein
LPLRERKGVTSIIQKCSDLAGRLFEAVFELEAQAIEKNDLDSAQGEIGAHQQPRTPCG